jgi:hypothetical protein
MSLLQGREGFHGSDYEVCRLLAFFAVWFLHMNIVSGILPHLFLRHCSVTRT